MKTICKFKITAKKEVDGASVKQPDGSFKPGKVVGLEAEPVTGGSSENDEFFAATPAGHLGLGVVKPESLAGLSEGDLIYVTIEKVPAEVAEEVTEKTGSL